MVAFWGKNSDALESARTEVYKNKKKNGVLPGSAVSNWQIPRPTSHGLHGKSIRLFSIC